MGLNIELMAPSPAVIAKLKKENASSYDEIERELGICGDNLRARLDRITRDLADGTISVAQARALIGLPPL